MTRQHFKREQPNETLGDVFGWLLLSVVVIIGVYTWLHVPEPRNTEVEQAAAMEARERRAGQLDQAVRSLCGSNAAYELGEDGWYQCYTKHGKKTIRVRIEVSK